MSQLGGWEGYRVGDWRQEDRGSQSWVVLELAPVEGAERLCSGCDEPVAAIHDQTVRRIRGLPLFDHAVELRVPRLRLACPRCGPRLERLDWLDPHARESPRLLRRPFRLSHAALA